jgi:hypothetical protein
VNEQKQKEHQGEAGKREKEQAKRDTIINWTNCKSGYSIAITRFGLLELGMSFWLASTVTDEQTEEVAAA